MLPVLLSILPYILSCSFFYEGYLLILEKLLIYPYTFVVSSAEFCLVQQIFILAQESTHFQELKKNILPLMHENCKTQNMHIDRNKQIYIWNKIMLIIVFDKFKFKFNSHMDEFQCPKCSIEFSQENPPKQLINCSHNLCFKCLKDQIICPIDRTRIEKRKYTIQAFETNTQLLQAIIQSKIIKEKQVNQQKVKQHPASKKSSKTINEFNTPNTDKYSSKQSRNQQVISKKQVIQVQLPCVSPQKENNVQKRLTISPKTVKISFDTCLLHSKKADLICLQDRCLICANCGLFGQHKLHKIISYDQFLSQYSSVTQESFKVYQEIKQRDQKLDPDILHEKKEQMLKDKRDVEVKNIKSYINGYIDFLRRLQKQLITDLDIAIDYKRKKLQKNQGIKQLLAKKQQYVASIQTMSNGVDDIFNLQNIGQYIDYIDKESPHSFIINQGEYLVVQIDNFYKQKMQTIAEQTNDISYQFTLSQDQLKETVKLVSSDIKEINELIEQSKKKLVKKPNAYSKINTPSRIQPSIPNNNSNSIKISTVSPNIKIINQQEQLLVGSGSKQSSKGSDNKMKKESSPIQISVIQIQHHPFIKPYDTYLNKEQDDCLKVSQIAFNSNAKHRKTVSSVNQSAKNQSRSKRVLQANRENQLSQSRAYKSRTKINTQRDTLINALGEKSQNKKKKKLDLPDKYMRIYQDLQKDKLQVLDLGGAFLGQANILAISQLFTSRCKLRIVKLMNNKISDDSLPQLLSRCKYVQSLNLSYNLLTQKSLDWLQQQASHLGQLKNITLSNNKIVLRNVRDRLQGLSRKGIKVSL